MIAKHQVYLSYGEEASSYGKSYNSTTFVYNPVLTSESSGFDKKSSPMTEKILVFSNCGSEEEARRIARALVEARVAACVNIVPGIQSIYHWQGAIQEDSEWMLVIKSTRSLFDQLSGRTSEDPLVSGTGGPGDSRCRGEPGLSRLDRSRDRPGMITS